MRIDDSATEQMPTAVEDRSTSPGTARPGAAPDAPRPATDPEAAPPGTSRPAEHDRRRIRSGTAFAALGVTSFSLTFPATAWALEGLGPWTVTSARSVLAALLAVVCLLVLRVPPPERRHRAGLLVVAAGVVLGFPLLTTLALETSTTSHAAVVVGLLPLTTATYSALRTGTRHSRTFWAAALAGAAVVVAFALAQSGGAPSTGDLYLFAALLVCAAGYAEGGRLAREMPGWQVISWALVACLPLTVPGVLVALRFEPAELTGHTVAGLLWLAVGSQFLGLVVWYRGMAAVGVAHAGQLQLAQPLLTLVWSVLLLGERIGPAAPVAAVAVLICIAVTQRSGRPGPVRAEATGRSHP